MAKSATIVRRAIRISTGDDFQKLVVELLDPLVGWLSPSKRLGRFDRDGLDCFRLDNEHSTIELAVQCKGFEKLDFADEQQKQCIDEVLKFARKGIRVKDYWLVVNRAILEPYRTELKSTLQTLVTSNQVESAQLLDLEHFFDQLQSLTGLLVERWFNQLRNEQFEYYDRSMRFAQYVDKVPFKVKEELRLRPAAYVIDALKQYSSSLHPDQTSKFRKHPKFVLTATFGFGKTETLHAISRDWLAMGGKVLYVPAAAIDSNGFSNTSNFVSSLLTLLQPDDVYLGDLTILLLRDTLRKWCESSQNTIMLIDGIDEHPAFLKSRMISSLWHLLQDLGVPSVITVRDELFEGRKADFNVEITNPQLQQAPQLQRLQLVEWSDENILEFLDSFSLNEVSQPSDAFVSLRNAVTNGDFSSIYGDIPRRPLFLGMLASDASAGVDPARNIALIYFSYFKSKLLRDVRGTLLVEEFVRSDVLLENRGIAEISRRLMDVMTDFAASLSREVRQGEVLHLVLIDEGGIEDLDRILIENRLTHASREEVLMHSLLQPAGRNAITGVPQVRFAHRSYLEWFVAKSLLTRSPAEFPQLPGAVMHFLEDMRLVGTKAFMF